MVYALCMSCSTVDIAQAGEVYAMNMFCINSSENKRGRGHYFIPAWRTRDADMSKEAAQTQPGTGSLGIYGMVIETWPQHWSVPCHTLSCNTVQYHSVS